MIKYKNLFEPLVFLEKKDIILICEAVISNFCGKYNL